MPRAERDLAELYEEIDAEHADQALLWYRGLKKAILCLARFPNRCPATPESRVLRHVLYGRRRQIYRVIYRVLDASTSSGSASCARGLVRSPV